MIVAELQKLKEDKTLISIERSGVSDDELTGFVLHTDDNLVIMRMYSDDGDYEGMTVFPTSQITEVFWGNRTHLAIHHLIEDLKSWDELTIDSVGLGDVVEELCSRYEAVGLMENGDEDRFDVAKYVGQDEEWLKLECYGTKKTLSKLTKLVKLDSISRVEFDTPYIRKIMKLHGTNL